MSLIQPFAGLRPVTEYADAVAAPPYDVLNSAEAREKVQGKPWSFLHVSKPEIDLPKGTDPHDAKVYAKGSENLQELIQKGILIQDKQPHYYVYRLIMGEHTQTGFVAASSVSAYNKNLIRKHEFTRPDKENDRVANIEALNAQTGPVLLTHKPLPQLNSLFAEITSGEPEADVTSEQKVRHTIWLVNDPEHIHLLTQAFDPKGGKNSAKLLYIADGHHRSAAASRVAESRTKDNPDHTGKESYNYFLSVIFSSDQMQIWDYNRVITDLKGMSEKVFLKALRANFTVEKSQEPVKPENRKIFGMYLPGQWYRLEVKEGVVKKDDPLSQLDVSILAQFLIEPVLGITDPRRDKRIDFVGGIRGLSELEKRVNSKEMAVAFSLFPTPLEDLMAVADSGEVMPPKSTWFEPKLADGLVSHVLD